MIDKVVPVFFSVIFLGDIYAYLCNTYQYDRHAFHVLIAMLCGFLFLVGLTAFVLWVIYRCIKSTVDDVMYNQQRKLDEQN